MSEIRKLAEWGRVVCLGARRVAVQITIDAEFSKQMPRLSDEEREQLEANILTDGCREPLSVWRVGEMRILLDGHNRHEICTRNGLEFRIVEVDGLESREDAFDWIDRNQIGRRNLTPMQLSVLRGRVYNRRKKRVGAPEGNQNRKQTRQSDGIETASEVASEFGVSPRTIERDGQLAEAVDLLGIGEDVLDGTLEASRGEVIEAARVTRETLRGYLEGLEDEESEVGSMSAEQVMEQARESLRKPHVANNSGENEWYSPPQIIELVREFYGGVIDLDPASSEDANELVQAKTIFTAEDDGLAQAWFGRVWMNPPYSQPLVRQFCEKLVDEFEGGQVTEAIALTNNCTETRWFQWLAASSGVLCLLEGRVRFWQPGRVAAPLQGQALIYLGPREQEFCRKFSVLGLVFVHAREFLEGVRYGN